jgi:hypothetical protein
LDKLTINFIEIKKKTKMKTKISLVIGASLLLQQAQAVQVRSFMEAAGLA